MDAYTHAVYTNTCIILAYKCIIILTVISTVHSKVFHTKEFIQLTEGASGFCGTKMEHFGVIIEEEDCQILHRFGSGSVTDEHAGGLSLVAVHLKLKVNTLMELP